MKRNREVEAALDELARHGQIGQVDRSGKHAKIYFNTPDGPRLLVCGATGSDGNAMEIIRGRVRRMIGVAYQGGAPGPAKRKVRRSGATRQVISASGPLAAVRPDPRAALLAHPLVRPELDKMASAAWAAWFGRLLRAQGHRPRSVAMRAA